MDDAKWTIEDAKEQFQIGASAHLALHLQSELSVHDEREVEDSAEGRDRSCRVFNDGVGCLLRFLVATPDAPVFSPSS